MLSPHTLKICILVLSTALSGCSAGISQQALSQVTYTGSFAELQAQPLRHQNEVVLAGGKIIDTLAGSDATEIIVLQMPLNRRAQPMEKDQSQGRFIVRSSQFFDPAVYAKGSLVTVVGRVISAQARPIGQRNYLYPVLDLVEIRKWTPGDLQSPRFHFGIGVGTSF